MPRKSLPDLWLALPVIVLVVLGIVMIYSASAFVAVRAHRPPYHFLVRQLVWAVVGGAALAAAYRIDYRIYRRWALPAAGIVLLLLIAVLIPPFGRVKSGVRRWIGLGPVDFQPSELAKLGLMIFLAAVLAGKRERFLRDGWKAILRELAVVGLALALIMVEPDLGTTITLAASLVALKKNRARTENNTPGQRIIFRNSHPSRCTASGIFLQENHTFSLYGQG